MAFLEMFFLTNTYVIMKCLKVSINEAKPVIAGFSDNENVLSCIVDKVVRNGEDREVIHLRFAGMDKNNVHYTWINSSIDIGDKIEISIMETDQIDEPVSIESEKQNDDDIIQSKLKSFYRLQEELKDYIK